MIKLAVTGCCGRMGQRIIALAEQDGGFRLHAATESPQRTDVPTETNGVSIAKDASGLAGSDVVIDFTWPEGSLGNVAYCVQHGIPIVIGTTGFTPEQRAVVEAAGKDIPVVFSSNMSVGVNLLFSLIRKAAAVTGNQYTMTIEETHHVHKKDAPSGTAKTMAEVAEEASGSTMKDMISHREGEVIGDHIITFESDVDTLSISHHAKTRDIFAEGALKAAKWLVGKPKGLYSMQDVLGLT